MWCCITLIDTLRQKIIEVFLKHKVSLMHWSLRQIICSTQHKIIAATEKQQIKDETGRPVAVFTGRHDPRVHLNTWAVAAHSGNILDFSFHFTLFSFGSRKWLDKRDKHITRNKAEFKSLGVVSLTVLKCFLVKMFLLCVRFSACRAFLFSDTLSISVSLNKETINEKEMIFKSKTYFTIW